MADPGHPPPSSTDSENCHQNLEECIYEYLVRKNLLHAAEVLRNEAKIVSHPNLYQGKKPEEGLLHTLWTASFEKLDFYRGAKHKSDTFGAPSTMMLEGSKHNVSQSRLTKINEQLLNRIASAMSKREPHSMALHVGSDQVPQEVLLSSNPEDLQKSTPGTSSVNIANTFGQQEPDPYFRQWIDSIWEDPPPSLEQLLGKPNEVDNDKAHSSSSSN